MATLQKKVRIRASRLVTSLVELRADSGLSAADMAVINACLEVARRAANDMEDCFAPGGIPAPTARPVVPQQAYTPAPVAARSGPVAPAVAAPVPRKAHTADDLKQAAAWVHECEIEGDKVTFYECQAFVELSKEAAWGLMDACEQAAAIRSKAAKLAASDTEDGVVF